MKNSILTVITCLSFIGSTAHAQTGRISGMVMNSEKKPLAGATVSLVREKDSVFVKISSTSDSGKFVFDQLAAANYTLQVSFAGYGKYISAKIVLTGENTAVALHPVLLLPVGPTTLKEFSIVAKTPFMDEKIDRTVVDIKQMISATGTNVLDMLGKIPGVQVSPEGAVSLMGKPSVMILIDDKPTHLSGQSLAGYLRALPSATVDKVELMTNPPASYDASGTGGIINIRVKKRTGKGFNGGINAAYGQGAYASGNSSLNLNYQRGKINLYAIAAYNFSETYRERSSQRAFLDPSGAVSSQINTATFSKENNNAPLVKLGLDYSPDKKTTWGIALGESLQYFPAQTTTNSTLLNPTGIPDSSYRSGVTDKQNFRKNQSITVNFLHQYARPGNELSFSLDYIRTTSDNVQLYENDTYLPGGTLAHQTRLTDSIPSSVHIYAAKADYTYPLAGKATIKFGVKSSMAKADNLSDYFTSADRFLYQEHINAAYVSLNKEFKRVTVQAGLRAEQTQISGQLSGSADSSFRQNYLNLFPTAFILYKLDSNANHQLNLNYGRRIDRPYYVWLNPARLFIDNYDYNEGNPYLKPTLSDNISLAYTFHHLLTASMRYFVVSDPTMNTYQEIPGSKTWVYRIENIGKRVLLGPSLSANLQPASWWGLSLLGLLNDIRYQGVLNGQAFNSRASTWVANAGNRFQFKGGWSGELTFNYNSGALTGQTELQAVWHADAGVQKKIFGNKGTLTLNVSDLFHTQHTTGKVLDLNAATQSFDNRGDTRIGRLSFSYNFGLNNQRRRNTTSGAEEESKRAGN